jgi:hypothetical protein
MPDGYIGNAAILAGGSRVNGVKQNTPAENSDFKTRHFLREFEVFTRKNARYASNYIKGQAEGIPDASRPKEWQDVLLRVADIVTPNAAITRNLDQYKAILVDDRRVGYIMPGTKFRFQGSTWLAFNAENVSAPGNTALVQHCNAVWTHYDYYGNIVQEPLCADSDIGKANAGDNQRSYNINLMYVNVRCQYNEDTRQLNTNSRIMLGSEAYRITGLLDFVQEHTGNYDSVRMLHFTLRFDEKNPVMDDLENRIADGRNFSFSAEITGADGLAEGGSTQLTPVFFRNGVIAEATEEKPLTWDFESTDQTVATVDGSGVVTGVSEGQCIIRAVLRENPGVYAEMPIHVTAEIETDFVFDKMPPDYLRAYQSVRLSATMYRGGSAAEDAPAIVWETDGASRLSYSAKTEDDDVIITCYKACDKPLTVTARCGEHTLSAEIELRGL